MNEAIKMQVSAFVDGELPENEAELLVRRLSQDAILRQQVAEYLAIGRIMRGEYSMKGSNGLRERIAAELEERPLQDAAETTVEEPSSRYVRPLAGFAIAATVALVAIFGLGRTVDPGIDPGTAAVVEEVASETVPTMSDEELRRYQMLHDEVSNSFNSRLANAQMMAEDLVPEDVDATEPDDESEDGAEEPVTSQPQ